MLSKFRVLLLAATTFSVSSFAQTFRWSDAPKVEQVPDSFKNESAVFLLEQRYIKYVPALKGNDIDIYRTIHRTIKLLDEKGVEYFNKMTIAPSADGVVMEVKGRTINADGKVINLNQDQIKSKPNENGDEQYHLAFEGVEVGDEVEVYYIEKRHLSSFGVEIMQIGLPIVHSSFKLEIPSFWTYETKGYNGFPKAKDTVINDQRIYTADQYNIDAVDEEPYSDVTPNLQRIEYKLDHTNEDPRKKLYTWNDLITNVYNNSYAFTEKELKAVRKFLEPLNIDQKPTEEDKIKTIETAIKTNIVFDDKLSGEAYQTMNTVLEKKTASESGIIRLFAACFQMSGVKHELGLTSNKFQLPLDDKFENWLRPDIYIFYFPGTKQYLSPSETTLRYPMISTPIRDNYAIFCTTTTFGTVTTPSASVRKIPQLDMSESSNYMKVDISFNKVDMSPLVKTIEGFKGYSALGMREYVTLITKDKEREMVQQFSKGLAQKPEDVISYSFNNAGLEHYSDNKPVEIVSEIKSDQLMETAGDKWLFKVGDVIGPQDEMYNDKKRKLPISYPFPHTLDREITIHIPDGYKITNPESVNKNEVVAADNMGFISNYTMNGNTMMIKIHEYYGFSHLPISEIDHFKSVVNASADFNKVTLVFEK